MKAFKKSRRVRGRTIVSAVGVAAALSCAQVFAQGVVYDNLTSVDAGNNGFYSVGVPDTFIGSPINLATGTTSISGFDVYPCNATNDLATPTNLSFEFIKINVYFWGGVNPQPTSPTNPAFTDLLTSTPLSYTIQFVDADGNPSSLAPGYYSPITNAQFPHVLPAFSFNSITVPSTAIGVTVEVQGSNDGVNFADYNGLSTLVSGGSDAPAAGSNIVDGWYRNANGETNGNFTSTLRQGGDNYEAVGVDLYGQGVGIIRNWINASGGTWTDPTQWSPTGVPEGNDTAAFNLSSSSPYAVQFNTGSTAQTCAILNDKVAFNLPETSSQIYFSKALTVGQSPSAGGTISGSLILENLVNSTTSIVEAGNFVVGGNGGTGTLTVGIGIYAVSDGDTSIAAGSIIKLQPFAIFESGTLTFAGATNAWQGQLDVGLNNVILRNGSIGSVMNQLKQGYNKGAWNGQGIISSVAAADSTHLTAVGAIVNNDGNGNQIYGNESTGTIALFNGFDPPLNAVLVKYTYYGDANLDGKVDGSDYSLIDNGFLNHLTGWYNGDFNYDGIVDGSDYTLLDNAFNNQDSVSGVNPDGAIGGSRPGPLEEHPYSTFDTGTTIKATPLPLPDSDPNATITSQIAGTAVPEPASLGIVALGTIAAPGRRSKRRVL